jgi:hypothetical protein
MRTATALNSVHVGYPSLETQCKDKMLARATIGGKAKSGANYIETARFRQGCLDAISLLGVGKLV